MTPVDHFWSLTCLGAVFLFTFVIRVNATPINRQVGISENVFITVQNDTYGIEQRVCSIDSMTYGDGETIPTSSPCEHCICRPPGFACTIISCDYRPGCKAFKRSNQCCPEYQCECEKDGRIYQNGEKIMDSNNPCEICYCQGGEIVCAVIDCYWRSDCQPRYIESRCCPLYDHCPPPANSGPYMRPTIPTTTTASGFPWFNLSSAVYEVPERATPTPVPVFLTSRSTEAPSTTAETTPTPSSPLPANSEPELVVIATERVPVEVNIMTAAEEHGEPAVLPANEIASTSVQPPEEVTQASEPSVDVPQEEVSVPSSGESTTSSKVPEQEPSTNVNLEPSAVVEAAHEESSVFEPTPPVVTQVFENSDLSVNSSVVAESPLPFYESTTVFTAPVIAISIIPSPVEQILVTQQALVPPQISSQVLEHNYEQNETVSPSEVTPESVVTDVNEVIVPSTELLPPQIAPQDNSAPAQESVPEQAEIVPTETPQADQSQTVEPESVTETSTSANVALVEAITSAPVIEESQQQHDVVAGVEEIDVGQDSTTTASIEQSFETSTPEQQVTSVPPTIAGSNKESVQPEVVVVTITPSAEDLESENATESTVQHDEIQIVQNGGTEPVSPISEDAPAAVTTTISPSNDFVSDGTETTTVSSVVINDGIVPEHDDAVSIFASDDVPQAPAAVEDDIETAPTTTASPVVQVHDETEDVANVQNTEPEVVTDAVATPEVTTVLTQADEVVVPTTTSSPHIPAVHQDEAEIVLNQDQEQVGVEVNASEGSVTSIHASPAVEPTINANEVQFDDAVHISADAHPEQDQVNTETPTIVQDEPVVAQQNPEAKVQQKPESVHTAHINEVNVIDENTFEIIPPQTNNADNLPEIQNQVLDEVPLEKSPNYPSGNEVDTPADRNTDDDTVEIFAGHSATSEIDANAHVNPEITTTPTKEQGQGIQDDSVVILPNNGEEDPVEDDTDAELMHPDDPQGSSGDATVATTEAPTVISEAAANDEVEVASTAVPTAVPTATPELHSQHLPNDSEDAVQVNDEVAFPETTPQPIQGKQVQSDESIVHDDSVPSQTTESVQLNDDVEIPTTTNPVAVNKVQKVDEVLKSQESDSKFRLDLADFDDFVEGSGSHEVQSSGTPSEVVFDEVQPAAPTNSPQHIVEEPIVRDDAFIVEITTNTAKLSRDDIDLTTTQKYRHDLPEELQPIRTFEFDEVPAAATTASPILSDDVASDNPEVTTVQPPTISHNDNAQNAFRAEYLDQTTVVSATVAPIQHENESQSDFVEVSTAASSGFGAVYREESLQDSTTIISPSYKSEVVGNDEGATTVESLVFEDDPKNDEVATTHQPRGKSDLEVTTTLETTFNDEAAHDEATTVISTVNDTATTKSHFISLDKMMIPEKGVVVPAVADDIVKPKSNQGRSDIGPLEGESDSWLVQTAIKNRQMQGLFPSSRSHKRLFRTRQPRDTLTSSDSSGSQPPKTYFKKTKKAPSEEISTQKPSF